MIHFFSGLFGGDETWRSYEHLGESRIHHVTDLPAHINLEDSLIGYSMGGRMALKLASNKNFRIKKLILLSAHPGLDENKRADRNLWENSILEKMDALSVDKFLEYWNSLDIFSQNQLRKELSVETFKAHRDCFDLNRLSLQKNYLPEMSLHRGKITYIYGKHDKKYSELANELRSHDISCVEIDTDHRVYLKPDLLIPILQRELTT